MSLDRSLKIAGGLAKHRNVLTRPERVQKLLERGRFDSATGDPLHLPKVGNRKITAGGKGTKKAEAGEAPAPAAAAAKAPDAAKKPAGDAKAAPAKKKKK